MYYVDLNIGKELLAMLQYTLAQPINTTADNSTFQPVISLTMHPAVGGFPSAWEFTLIIVVALLAISFLASSNHSNTSLDLTTNLFTSGHALAPLAYKTKTTIII